MCVKYKTKTKKHVFSPILANSVVKICADSFQFSLNKQKFQSIHGFGRNANSSHHPNESVDGDWKLMPTMIRTLNTDALLNVCPARWVCQMAYSNSVMIPSHVSDQCAYPCVSRAIEWYCWNSKPYLTFISLSSMLHALNYAWMC